MDHHSIPKIGFSSVDCKPASSFLPNISPRKSVTLKLSQGTDKHIISLPTDRLNQNKKYYVTFTVKSTSRPVKECVTYPSHVNHRHARSD